MNNNVFWKTLIVILTVATVTLAGTQIWQWQTLKSNPPVPVAAPTYATAQPMKNTAAAAIQEEFAKVAERCAPAVVVVKTGRRVVHYIDSSSSRLYHYFRHGQVPQVSAEPTGLGSGFFVNPDGYILTNYHIVRDQDYFQVELFNRKEYPAELVGSDPLSDLAVLHVKANEKFPYLEFADSDRVKVGYWAIAIGAPFSLEHSVTVGIVSHLKRTMGMNVHENFIQTDASINQGNSGGPLLDINGKVMGINDFIITPTEGNIGLSFSIASNLAEKICKKLMRSGRVAHPWLGISMMEVPVNIRDKWHLDGGVMVMELLRQGPAAKAGMMAGDVIIAINNAPIKTTADLQTALINVSPGDRLIIKVNREGLVRERKVVAGSIPHGYLNQK